MERKSAHRNLEVLMLFFAKTDNKEYQVEVRENATEWEVSLTDIKTETKEVFQLLKKDYKQFGEVISFIFKHRSYLIDIVQEGDDYTVFTKGTHKTIQLLTEEHLFYNKLVEGDVASKGIHIKSGMPGKVVEVYVKSGDSVNEGDLLLVIEAMKMENEIRGSTKGKVKKMYVKAGQSVETGNLLLSIQPIK